VNAMELKDKYSGRKVAHVAARYGCLPADFDQWDLADEDGQTVAHVAAAWGHLLNSIGPDLLKK